MDLAVDLLELRAHGQVGRHGGRPPTPPAVPAVPLTDRRTLARRPPQAAIPGGVRAEAEGGAAAAERERRGRGTGEPERKTMGKEERRGSWGLGVLGISGQSTREIGRAHV